MMGNLGFSSAIVTQLSLAEVHGNLHLSLGKIEEYLDNLAKVKKKLIEVATYPLILLAFLLAAIAYPPTNIFFFFQAEDGIRD